MAWPVPLDRVVSPTVPRSVLRSTGVVGKTFPAGVWPAELVATEAVICEVAPPVWIAAGFAESPKTRNGSASTPAPTAPPGPLFEPNQLFSAATVPPVEVLATPLVFPRIRLNAAVTTGGGAPTPLDIASMPTSLPVMSLPLKTAFGM